jgi:hypothetical protein
MHRVEWYRNLVYAKTSMGSFCCLSHGLCAGTKEITDDHRISGLTSDLSSASPEYEGEVPVAGPPLLQLVFALEPVKTCRDRK